VTKGENRSYGIPKFGNRPADLSNLDWLEFIDPQIVACLSPLERLLLSVLREYRKEKEETVVGDAVAESMDSKAEEPSDQRRA